MVHAVAGDIVLCSWARNFTFTVSLSTQEHKWVPENLVLGVTQHPIEGGVEIFQVASCYGNWDELQPDEPLGLYTDLTNLFRGIWYKRNNIEFSGCLSC